MPPMYSGLPRNWKALAARGVLAVLFGLFCLTQPRIALPALVVGFGVAVLLSGILAIVAGVLTAAFGVMMVLLPWAGLMALSLLVGASSFCFGVLLIVVAFRLRTRWLVRHPSA